MFRPLHLRIVLVIAAVAATFGGSTATAAAAEPLAKQVGIGTHTIWLGQADAERELRPLREGGFGWIREDFRWDFVEPTKGTFDWSRTDNLMASASRSGLDVLAVLDYSAPWASSDPSGGGDVHYPPKNNADYANYARRVVERYGADGAFWTARPELPRRPLAAVEVWNEPNGAWFWKPGPDPAAYARLARAAATAIKAASPTTKVIVSGELIAFHNDGRGTRWLEPMLEAEPSLGSLIDAYATHPYPHPRERSPFDTSSPIEYRFDRARTTRDIARRYGADKPVWITEIGWSTATGIGDSVTEAVQAQFLRDAVENAVTTQQVEKIFLFSWDKGSGVNTDRDGNYGLRRSDGSLKPAWASVTKLLKEGLQPSDSPAGGDTTGPVSTDPPADTTPTGTPSPAGSTSTPSDTSTPGGTSSVPVVTPPVKAKPRPRPVTRPKRCSRAQQSTRRAQKRCRTRAARKRSRAREAQKRRARATRPARA